MINDFDKFFTLKYPKLPLQTKFNSFFRPRFVMDGGVLSFKELLRPVKKWFKL